MDEAEGVESRVQPFSRRMGWLDIPICLLSLAHSTVDGVATFFSDVIMVTAGHANYLRDEHTFKEIVKHYDDPSGVGSGCTEPTD